jgi:hypothetical protein
MAEPNRSRRSETRPQDLPIEHEGSANGLDLSLVVPVSIELFRINPDPLAREQVGQIGTDAAVPVDQRSIAVECQQLRTR